MNITLWLQYLLPALLTLSLALPAALAQAWLLFFLALMGGVLWVLTLTHKKIRANNSFFVLFSLLIAWAYFQEVGVILLSVAMCLNLASWNIANLRSALAQVDRVDNLRQMELARLKRLGIALAAGFGLTLIPSLVQIRLSFLLTAVLITLVIVFLGRVLTKLPAEQTGSEKPEP